MSGILNASDTTSILEIENELIRLVSLGDYKNALISYHKFKSYRMIPCREYTLERGKKEVIIMNTLLRKSLEYAKIHPYYVVSIYENFSSKIDKILDIQSIFALEVDMIQKYCDCVQLYPITTNNPIIQKVIHYINLNLGNELSLKTLAETFHLNDTYLCKLFKKETGYTLTQYISNQRIKYACTALCYSSNSIAVIALNSGYTDVNYFSRLFKQIVGVTPSQYRKTHAKI